jgi:hypothetical protein
MVRSGVKRNEGGMGFGLCRPFAFFGVGEVFRKKILNQKLSIRSRPSELLRKFVHKSSPAHLAFSPLCGVIVTMTSARP